MNPIFLCIQLNAKKNQEDYDSDYFFHAQKNNRNTPSWAFLFKANYFIIVF